MAQPQISKSDEGKRVVDRNGNEIGIVSGFRSGSAYVEPDPGITDTVRSKLGWDTVDEDDYLLDPSEVATITEDEVRLNR